MQPQTQEQIRQQFEIAAKHIEQALKILMDFFNGLMTNLQKKLKAQKKLSSACETISGYIKDEKTPPNLKKEMMQFMSQKKPEIDKVQEQLAAEKTTATKQKKTEKQRIDLPPTLHL